MTRLRTPPMMFAAILFGSAVAGAAHAAPGDKTYAAFFGNDGNDCLTPPTACRSLQRVIDQTNPGGEVVLDPAPVYDAGGALITFPLTVNFQGNQSDVPIGNPPANIQINTASGNDTVNLLGLHMNLHGAIRNGIQVNRGNLNLNNVTIENGGGNKSGVFFQPNRNARLTITNGRILGVGNALTIDARAGADVVGIVDNALISQNRIGIQSIAGAGTTQNITINGSTIVNNITAFHSEGGGSHLFSRNNLITGNGVGIETAGAGTVTSLTGNSLFGNGINGAYNGTVGPQ